MLRGDIAAGPRPDLDDKRLAQRGFEFLRDEAGDDIGHRPGREADHDAYRLGRIILRDQWREREHHPGDASENVSFHLFLPPGERRPGV